MDAESEGRVAASRQRLQKLHEKLAQLRSRVGQLHDAVVELNVERAQVAGQLQRAQRAVHECADVVESVAARQSHAPPGACVAREASLEPKALGQATSEPDAADPG